MKDRDSGSAWEPHIGARDLAFQHELDRLMTARETRVVLNVSGLRKLERAKAMFGRPVTFLGKTWRPANRSIG